MPKSGTALPRTSSEEVESLRRRVAELEAQLAQSQKLHLIGSLAGGVAHDFNNLLTAILGYASLLREDASCPPHVLEALAVIEKAAERASQLTGQLLGFARPRDPRRVRMAVHDSLEEVAELLRHTIDKNIRIETDFTAGDSHVIGEPGQLFQVFLNLALNARDAMPSGGTLGLRTTRAGYFLRVTISDTGPGIAPEIRDRIFEPFFTTKEAGKGTGLGLTVVESIVRSHGGSIQLDPAAGPGAHFHVLLPLAAGPGGTQDEAPSAAQARGRGAVLVIDDEEVVRQVAAKMLRKLGYRPVCIGNAREAVDYFRRRSRDLDLVLLDLIMPEMSGQAVFEELARIDPAIPVVVTSGYGRDSAVDALIAAGARGFLQKPYRMNQLSDALAGVFRS